MCYKNVFRNTKFLEKELEEEKKSEGVESV